MSGLRAGIARLLVDAVYLLLSAAVEALAWIAAKCGYDVWDIEN